MTDILAAYKELGIIGLLLIVIGWLWRSKEARTAKLELKIEELLKKQTEGYVKQITELKEQLIKVTLERDEALRRTGPP